MHYNLFLSIILEFTNSFGNIIQNFATFFYIKKLKNFKISVDFFSDLLYYKYAIKTQVSHKPVQDKNFIKKEVMNYDNDAEDPGKEVQERFYTR